MPSRKEENELSAPAAEFLGARSYAELLQKLTDPTSKSASAVTTALAQVRPASELPEPEPAGVFPAPIVGYRAWELSDGARPRLRSLTSGTAWPVREPLVASCPLDSAKPHDAAPDWDCPCGIYAYAEPDMLSAPGMIPSMLPSVAIVRGEVNLWGKVIRHKAGYRAQYAYPRRLHISARVPWASLVAEALERDYGVPCDVQVPRLGHRTWSSVASADYITTTLTIS